MIIDRGWRLCTASLVRSGLNSIMGQCGVYLNCMGPLTRKKEHSPGIYTHAGGDGLWLHDCINSGPVY